MISSPFTLIAPSPLFAVALRKAACALLSLLTLAHGNETAREPHKCSPWRFDAASGQFTRTTHRWRWVGTRKTRREGRTEVVNGQHDIRMFVLSNEHNPSLASFRGKVYFFSIPSGCFFVPRRATSSRSSIQGKSIILANNFHRNSSLFWSYFWHMFEIYIFEY